MTIQTRNTLSRSGASSRRRTRAIAWIACALAVAAHWHLHLGFRARWNTDHPPQGTSIASREAAPREGVRRLVVVLVDGLGWEAAMRDPTLRELGRRGAARPLIASFPTYTSPGITSLMTGRPPVYSGVRANGRLPDVQWDSLPLVAARNGYSVRVSNNHLDTLPALLRLPDAAVGATLEEIELRAAPQTLDVVYLRRVDRAGHRHGAGSAQYRAAIRAAAATVARIESTLDHERDALVVVSDHGHLPAGGHGGAEPDVTRGLFIAIGPGLSREDDLAPAPMRTFAPTMAVLLGAAGPADALSEPMLDLLDGVDVAGETRLERRARRDFAVRASARAGAAILFLAALGLALSRLRLLDGLRARDFAPVLANAAALAWLLEAFGLGFGWSVHRHSLEYQYGLVALASVAAAISIAAARPARAVHETLAALVLWVPLLTLAGAWVGASHTWIAGPTGSYVLVHAVTLATPALLVLGLRAWLLAPVRGRPLHRILSVLLAAASLMVLLALPIRLWREVLR